MLPCKKRRSTVPESPQHKGQQEEVDVDLESAVNLDSAQVRELQSVSLCWGPSPDRRAGPEVACVQDAGRQAAAEDAPLSARTLTQDTHFPVLDGVDVDMAQGITLPALESFPSLDMHMGKGKFQTAGSRRAKRVSLSPGSVTVEDRGDRLSKKETFSEESSSEEGKEEGGKPQMHSGGAMPFLPSGIQSTKPGAQPRKSSQPDVCASQEKTLRTVAHQAEEETEDGGLFIPMEQDSGESEKRRKKKKGTKRKRDGKGQEEGTLAYDLKLDDMLDRTLEDGAKQHNLTAVNVRNILHVSKTGPVV